MELNHSTPIIHVWVRNEFLYNHESGHGQFTEGYIFGVSSMKGRALGFNVMLKTGAHFRWMPVHAFYHLDPGSNPCVPDLSDVELWDCFSNSITVTEYEYLKAHECDVRLRSGDIQPGVYLFTVDWLPDQINTSFVTEPDQNKCAHIIALEAGWLCAMPTNRCLFKDSFFIGNQPTAHKQGYKTATTLWQAETAESNFAGDDRVFYEETPHNIDPSLCPCSLGQQEAPKPDLPAGQ